MGNATLTKQWKQRNPEAVREQRRRHRAKHRELRRMAITTWKLAVGCMNCGYDEHPEALDFDHLDPDTKVSGIGTMISECRPWALILDEIAKCRVLCANCHRIITSEQRPS